MDEASSARYLPLLPLQTRPGLADNGANRNHPRAVSAELAHRPCRVYPRSKAHRHADPGSRADHGANSGGPMLNSLVRRIATHVAGRAADTLRGGGRGCRCPGWPSGRAQLAQLLGPNDKTRHRLVLDLDWRNRQVTEQIQSRRGRLAGEPSRASGYATWTMRRGDARCPIRPSRPQKWVGTRASLRIWVPGRTACTRALMYSVPRRRFRLTLH